MSKSQRTKGAAGEREAASLLRPIFPAARRRSCGEESQVRRGADLAGVEPLCIQVKLSGCPNPLAALAEAVACRGLHEIPVALVRQCRRGKSGDWVAVLPADQFVRLLERAGYGKSGDPGLGARPVSESEACPDIPA